MAYSGADGLAERVHIVLVEPQVAGNVGAVARAMRNFGFRHLWLVRPAAWDPEAARWMAPGCDDLLAGARVVSELDAALVDVGYAVATTARHRRGGTPVTEPAALAADLHARSDRVAILFGREDHGLDRQSVDRCAALLRIPTGPHASLNLAAAALVVCYALHEASRGGRPAPGRTLAGSRRRQSTAAAQRADGNDQPASLPDLEPVVDRWIDILTRVGNLRSADPLRAAAAARRWLQRAGTSRREADALRGALRDLDRALTRAPTGSSDTE